MQVTGQQLSEELLELLPDYELAWTQHDDISGAAATGVNGQGGYPSGTGSQLGGAGTAVGAAVGEAAAATEAASAVSSNGFSAFYRTDSTSRLSKEFGDLMYKMRDLEVRWAVASSWGRGDKPC